MKNLYSSIILTLITTIGFSQSETSWTEVVSHNGVVIRSQKVHCDNNRGFDEERVLFQFENTTNKDLILDWDFSLYYNNTCLTCDLSGEHHRTMTITANSTISGACKNKNKNLSIFSKFDDPNYNPNAVTNYTESVLTNYIFSNLVVSKE